MLDVVKKLERWVTLALIVMLGVVVLLATVELGVTIVRDVATPPVLFPGIDRLLDLFSRFLLVLIGIELVETMRTFAHGGAVRVEVVITVAMIALARKVIVLEIAHVSGLSMIGLAAVLAALSFAYRVVVRQGGGGREGGDPPTAGPGGDGGPVTGRP
jgi:uncharacterized membrane protein (DUF373 family)